MIRAEDELRQLFAEAPQDARVRDPYVSLIDVYANEAAFKYEPETPAEAAVPKLLTAQRDAMAVTMGESSICSRSEFESRFQAFTNGVFAGLNWNNVFCAGGSVLACTMRETSGFQGSDIDLFLYGLNSDAEASAKLREIAEVVQRNSNSRGDMIRTHRAVTFIGEYPFRHIQIILKVYRSPAEVLLGFDVDSCCFGYNGGSVFCPLRAQRALNKRYNLVNMTRRSLTYETRLKKYSKRGFAVAVPDLDKARVDPALLRKNMKDVQGLAKLLIAEFENLNARESWRNMRRFSKMTKTQINEFTADAVEEYETVHQASDYSDVFIPWGPRWYSKQIMRLLDAKDRAAYFQQRSKGPFQHKHIFVTGIDAIVSGPIGHEAWCIHCREKSARLVAPPGDVKSVPQALEWVKDAPAMQDLENGRQRALMIGSFFPVIELNWTKDCYLSPGAPAPTPHPLQIVQTGAGSAGPAQKMPASNTAAAAAAYVSNPFGAKKEAKAAKQPAAGGAFSFGRGPASQPQPAASSTTYTAFNASPPKSNPQAHPFNAASGPTAFGAGPIAMPANPFGAAPASGPFGNGSAPATQYTSTPFMFAGAPPTAAMAAGTASAMPAMSAATPTSAAVRQALGQAGPDASPMTAALLVIKSMAATQALTPEGKGALKDLALQQDHRIFGTMGAYNVDHDIDELCDSLRRLSLIVTAAGRK